MRKKVVATALVLGCMFSSALAADNSKSASISVSEIVARNAASRGGLAAWRRVQSLAFEGKLGAGGDQRGTVPSAEVAAVSGRLPKPRRLSEEAMLPFTMELQRPKKTRIEVQFRGQSAVQVYDGSNGWKLRPFLNRLEVEPFTSEERRLASMQSDLDGPLLDYAAKGTRVELDGTEQVEGKQAYKLKLVTKAGQVIHVWIDAESFLEDKVEGQPRELDGKLHPVEIYYRDYREVEGLKIPFLLETRVLPAESGRSGSHEPAFPPEKIQIERVKVNPKLDTARFGKPQVSETGAHPQGL